MPSLSPAILTRLLGGLVLAVGLTGLAAVPPAAADALITPWQAQTASASRDWDGLAYGNGRFVAVAALTSGVNGLMTSPDGINWTNGTLAVTNKTLRAVTFGNGTFVAVGASGTVMTSPDGDTWTMGTGLDATSNYYAVTFGNGRFVAVGGAGRVIAYSLDGSTWTQVAPQPTLRSLRGVAYGNGLFVAVGSNNASGDQILTSTDGITWTTRTAPEVNDWFSVAFGDGQFVAVSTDGTNQVMTSPDGITWTSRAAAAAAPWRSVAYGGGVWVAVAGSGKGLGGGATMVSRDGVTWTSVAPTNTNSWREVAFGAGLFVALSNDGDVMTSEPLAPAGAQDVIVRQALPLGMDSTCNALDDAAYEYGTGLTGGWQRAWEPWPNEGLGGWACLRVLVNSAGTWRIDNAA